MKEEKSLKDLFVNVIVKICLNIVYLVILTLELILLSQIINDIWYKGINVWLIIKITILLIVIKIMLRMLVEFIVFICEKNNKKQIMQSLNELIMFKIIQHNEREESEEENEDKLYN